MTSSIRHFHAQARVEDAHPAAISIEAGSFEEAALVFVESFPGADDECRVTVRDTQTGEQHCFSLHHDGQLTEGC